MSMNSSIVMSDIEMPGAAPTWAEAAAQSHGQRDERGGLGLRRRLFVSAGIIPYPASDFAVLSRFYASPPELRGTLEGLPCVDEPLTHCGERLGAVLGLFRYPSPLADDLGLALGRQAVEEEYALVVAVISQLGEG